MVIVMSEVKNQTTEPFSYDPTEAQTRARYIDTMLIDAGWVKGVDWREEVELAGMPNQAQVGFADYVLYGDDGKALAVVEAKRTSVDVAKGRQQAKLYADLLERKYGRRPVVFLSNGFETRMEDGQYPERKVAAIYSKRDLEKLFNLRRIRTSLANVSVREDIAGRYYQKGAVRAVCDSLDRKNRRRALLVMATGSGKTRTVIALVDILLRHNWVKNVLFLADRNSLVTQAKRSFVNLLENLSVTNLCEEKDNFAARCVFSTYQTMMNCIDTVAETKLKFLEEGIAYDDLPPEEQAAYEETFLDENGDWPDRIGAGKLNEVVFNEDTIRLVLHVLMTEGLRVNYGETLGKTILFAKNHAHAEKILQIFGEEYPHLPGYAKVIDNYMTYAQSAIDEFSEADKLPRIAISVDMLDTGIDVPEILNLVFFKPIMSKAKFWQMIGRGTRLCPGLLDGEDKTGFNIFDFCGNFAFFRLSKGKPTPNGLPLQGAIFGLKAQIAWKLQDLDYQTEELITFRRRLVEEMAAKVRELNRDNFAVKQHLRFVEQYNDERTYDILTEEKLNQLRAELTPLILPDEDEASAVRFDALLYGIELAYLADKTYTRAKKDLVKRVAGIAGVANIPEIAAQSELIENILHGTYLDRAGIHEFEYIRQNLRDLMKYIPRGSAVYTTNFTDEILSTEWTEADLENDDLKNYKAKAEFYIRKNQDAPAIAKLRSNLPLGEADVQELEQILWSKVGTKEDYEAEYGQKPLGELVREIVGLDMNAAKAAFSRYLNDTNLDARQIYFVNQIVEYIVHNGMLRDLRVLQGPPFDRQGSLGEVFQDFSLWQGIRQVIDQINANAGAA